LIFQFIIFSCIVDFLFVFHLTACMQIQSASDARRRCADELSDLVYEILRKKKFQKVLQPQTNICSLATAFWW